MFVFALKYTPIINLRDIVEFNEQTNKIITTTTTQQQTKAIRKTKQKLKQR